MQTSYTVSGLTCHHCVDHVLTEIRAIPEVTAASLNLDDGCLTIDTATGLDLAVVEAAVHEAGEYEVVPA